MTQGWRGGKGCEDGGKEERGVRIGVAVLCAANVHHVLLLGTYTSIFLSIVQFSLDMHV